MNVNMESNTSTRTGFKGKRPSRKFGRHGRTGGADRKSTSSHQSPPELQPVIDVAGDVVVPVASIPFVEKE